MAKYLIGFLFLTLIATGCENKNRPNASKIQKTAVVAQENLNNKSADDLASQTPDEKLDLMELVKLQYGQIKVTLKSTEKMQTESFKNVYLITNEAENVKCDFFVASFDHPKAGDIYRRFNAPMISKIGDLEIVGKIIDNRSALKQTMGFTCYSGKAFSVAKLTVGHLKTLFKDSLEITVVPR